MWTSPATRLGEAGNALETLYFLLREIGASGYQGVKAALGR